MRILIATVTAGGGHLAAATALEEAWRAFRPEDTVEKLDVLALGSKLNRKLHADGYVQLAEHAPELWGLLFNKTDNLAAARRLARLRKLLPSVSRARFARHVAQFEPDAVLCTHYLPLEGLEPTEKRERGAPGAGPFVASIVTDFEAHALWMAPWVDLYCVAAEETKARLLARGADVEQVVATGIPIAAKFNAEQNIGEIRRKLGLRDDLPVLLVLSGGFGMGPVGEILVQLDKVQRDFQALVVTGRNQELRQALAVVDRRHPTDVLGYAPNMHELMAVADLILSKPGGLTTSEALALGKPLFVLNPIPGQEAANSDFLLEKGAATKVNRMEDIPYRVEQLLGSTKLQELSRAAKVLGRPKAAQEICELVWRRWSAGGLRNVKREA
jgi:processive 1,2-diacylglycerol beta-glucosyltransferase